MEKEECKHEHEKWIEVGVGDDCYNCECGEVVAAS